MSSTARAYSGHLSRLRQSSGVILRTLCGVFCRASKRLSCSSCVMDSQNFTTTVPAWVICSSKALISS